MTLLANRVRAWSSVVMMASISVTPCARAAVTTSSNSASFRICASDFDLAEARGAGAVAGAHYLLRLALAAVGNAPEGPMLFPGDGVAGVPEFRGDTAVAGVLQHADTAAVADLPRDFAAELEVVSLVIDRPAPVGLHVDAMRQVEDFVE